MTHQPSGRDTAQAGRLADRIAAAVAGCPAVAALADGPVATYLPGRTVPGVAVRDNLVVVAVVARHGPPLAEAAGQVRAAVAGVAPGLAVDVYIDDIQLPDADPGSREDGA
jgi:hypothetical protein